MEYIQLKKDSIFRLGIKDQNGNPKLDEKGNEVCLEFDLEDIEIPLKYNKCKFLIEKAQEQLKMAFIIIDKKEDKRGKNLLSSNEEEKLKALQTFYKEAEDAMNLFIGENGVEKVFGKRKYLTMFDDLSDMIEPFLPKIKVSMDDITKKIKNKYKVEENDVLMDE